jgi:hypothetical protein
MMSFERVCLFSFLRRSENPEFRICRNGSGAQRPETQDVAVFLADDDAICCVPPLPRDRRAAAENSASLIPDRGTLPETAE